MDRRGSSTCRSAEKRLHVVFTFEAPNVWRQLWRQKFCKSAARSDGLANLFFLQALCVCDWCVSWLKCALHGKRTNPPWSILLLFIWYAMRSVHVASSKISRYIWQITCEISEMGAPKVLKEAGRCQPVRKHHFLFAREPAKFWQNGPASMHVH